MIPGFYLYFCLAKYGLMPVIKLKKWVLLEAHRSVKKKPTSPPITQTVIFKVFNSVMFEFWEMNKTAVRVIL